MHQTSLDNCQKFIDKYLHGQLDLLIADVGSYDVNGTYRHLLDKPDLGWKYLGLDIQAGPNVDIVVPGIPIGIRDDRGWRKPYRIDPQLWNKAVQFSQVPHPFDIVISGQCLEHVTKPWVWIKQVDSILRRGGLAWITAPNTWGHHPYPVDCWRVWPDGIKALFDEVGWECLEAFVTDCDTVGIARKPR